MMKDEKDAEKQYIQHHHPLLFKHRVSAVHLYMFDFWVLVKTDAIGSLGIFFQGKVYI